MIGCANSLHGASRLFIVFVCGGSAVGHRHRGGAHRDWVCRFLFLFVSVLFGWVGVVCVLFECVVVVCVLLGCVVVVRVAIDFVYCFTCACSLS